MNVLLTGAQGFCGNHLLTYLGGKQLPLWATARDWKAVSPAGGNIHRISTDFSDMDCLPGEIDAVVHAAASLSVGQATDADFQKNNTDLTRQLVDYAVNAGARLFVFFSAISVYGEVNSKSVREDTPRVNPDAYSVSKLEGERYLAAQADSMASVSLRLPSILGPGAKHGWLTGVAGKMQRNEAVEFLNPETPFNNAVHIYDLMMFIEALLTSPPSGATPVNLSLAGQLPVGQVLSSLKEHMNSRSDLRPRRDADRPGFLIDSSLAQEEFGWQSRDVETLISSLSSDGAFGV